MPAKPKWIKAHLQPLESGGDVDLRTTQPTAAGGHFRYRRIAALLRQEGWRAGQRHIQRLRRAEGLRVPRSRRKLVRRGVSTGLPTTATHRGHVWTWDFIADATVRGGVLRILTILDEHTREAAILAAVSACRRFSASFFAIASNL